MQVTEFFASSGMLLMGLTPVADPPIESSASRYETKNRPRIIENRKLVHIGDDGSYSGVSERRDSNEPTSAQATIEIVDNGARDTISTARDTKTAQSWSSVIDTYEPTLRTVLLSCPVLDNNYVSYVTKRVYFGPVERMEFFKSADARIRNVLVLVFESKGAALAYTDWVRSNPHLFCYAGDAAVSDVAIECGDRECQDWVKAKSSSEPFESGATRRLRLIGSPRSSAAIVRAVIDRHRKCVNHGQGQILVYLPSAHKYNARPRNLESILEFVDKDKALEIQRDLQSHVFGTFEDLELQFVCDWEVSPDMFVLQQNIPRRQKASHRSINHHKAPARTRVALPTPEEYSKSLEHDQSDKRGEQPDNFLETWDVVIRLPSNKANHALLIWVMHNTFFGKVNAISNNLRKEKKSRQLVISYPEQAPAEKYCEFFTSIAKNDASLHDALRPVGLPRVVESRCKANDCSSSLHSRVLIL